MRLGWLSPLEGAAFHRPPGQTCLRTRRKLGHRGLRFGRACQRLQSQYGVCPATSHPGTVVKRMRLLCYGCRATATALPVVFVTVLLPTGSGSARAARGDGFCASTTNHPYSPSLVVGSLWDATRRELWETALLSATDRLPVREYWTQ